jgi:putative Holliday junction resolvase
MRVLGVDFGLRRLGLALSDPSGSLASPYRELRIGSVREAPAVVAAAAREAEAAVIVVGIPLGLEGEEARPEVRRVERFAKALRRETGLPVHFMDESMSSREAEDLTGGPRRRGRDEANHSAAAAVILQRWLDRSRASASEGRP